MPLRVLFRDLVGQPQRLAGISPASPLAAGLVAAWPNGGGSTLLDAVAGRHLVLGFPGIAGGSNFRGSRFGNTLFLDGGNANVNASSADAALGMGGATELTLSVWISPRNASRTNTGIMGRWGGSGFMLYVNPELRLYINGTNIAASGSATPNANQWVHLAGTWSGATQRGQLYINGVQVLDAALAQTTITAQSGIGFNIGTYNGAGGTLYDGGVAIPAVWRRKLSATQIRGLYEEPWSPFEPQRRNIIWTATASGGMDGSAVASATASGALSTGISLAAAAAAAGSATGALSTAIRLAAAAVGSTAASGSLTTGISLAATAQASSTASGALTTAIALSATATATAAGAAALSTSIQLAGTAAAVATAGGALTAGGSNLQASAVAATTASGSLTTAITLAGAAAGAVTATGALTAGAGTLGGQAAVVATAGGALSTGIVLQASAVAVATAGGALTTGAGTLGGQAAVVAQAGGALSTGILLRAGAVAVVQASGALTVGSATAAIPASRTLTVPADVRLLVVGAEERRLVIPLEDRRFVVAAD